MIRRAVVAAIAAATFLVMGASPAWAHAVLQASSPADGTHLDDAPALVSLTFSEPVHAPLGAVRVFDQRGGRVDNGNVVARDNTVTVGIEGGHHDGAYVVTWRVISADSHPVRGAFTFTVGNVSSVDAGLVASVFDQGADRRWEIAGAFARGFAYAGTLLAAGGALFLALVHDGGAERPLLRRVTRGAALVGGGGVVVALPIDAALATGLGLTAITKSGVLGDVSGDGVGLATLLALAGLVTLCVGLERRAIALIGAAVAALSFAFAGHTTTTDPRWLSETADFAHVGAAAAWFGGIVLLVLVLRARRASGQDPVATGRVVARFTTMATAAVLVVLVTGGALGWTEVRAVRALTSTTYGRLLMVKTALALVIAGVGAYNHYRLVPALQRAADAGRNVWRHLLRTVRVEAAGMVVVLAITAVLVNVTPARTAAGIGTIFSKTEAFGPNSINLVVDPNRAGRNSIHLYLLDPSGRPANLAQTVTLELSLPSSDLGPLTRQPFVAGPGHYQLDSNDLTIPGTWTIVVRAEISKFEEQSAKFDVTVNP